MPLSLISRQVLVALMITSLLIPGHLIAAEPPVTGPTTAAPMTLAMADVTLGPNGRLSGQVVDANGLAKANCELTVEQGGEKIAVVSSDKQGRFAAENVRPGVCHVKVNGLVSTVRCWTNNAAPPAAKPEVLVISDPLLERGQRPIGEILTNPLLITLVIAAAVAIPIAVHNSQKSGS